MKGDPFEIGCLTAGCAPRTGAILNAHGHVVEPRAQLPAGDMRLSDGRELKDRGPWMHGRQWRSANGLLVLASVDLTPHGPLLHVSMSYTGRDPSWEDIKAVRDAFFEQDIDAMMLLPKRADYVNVHRHTFHLWQTPTEWGVR